MKKRLLSAALALAMVLTMLPLSVFADVPLVVADATTTTQPDGDGTERVAFQATKTANYPDAPAWYVTHTTPAKTENGVTTPAKTEYLKVDEGLSVGGYYYKDATPPTENTNITLNDNKNGIKTNTSIYSATYNTTESKVVQGNLKGSVMVIGGDFEIDAVNATSLTLDVYGGTATIKGNKLTSVAVTNSQYATQGKGTVKLGTDVAGQLTSLTLNHVTYGDNALEMNHSTTSSATHTLTFNDVTSTANITMNGTYTTTAQVTNTSAQTVSITKSSIGSLAVTGNSSRVTLNEMPANGTSTVSITGTACTFTFQGGGKIGELTITGSSAGGTNGADLTTAPSSVSVAAGCEVGAINSSLTTLTNEKAAGRNTVTINGTTGAINFRNAAITVNGGTVGAIKMETGTVSVSGNRATVGDVSLAHDATFTLSGTNCKIGALEVTSGGNPSSVTFTVPNEPSNVLGTDSKAVSNYTKQTISGGTWLSKVDAKVLSTSLAYQMETTDSSNAGQYTYYTASQLGEAIIAQGGSQNKTLSRIGDDGTENVTFMNGSSVWGVLTSSANVTIQLPTQMNSVSTPYWTDGKFTNLAGNYNVPAGGATLNAGDGAVTGEVTELTNVEIDGTSSDIKATLVGNVITLSGAVNTGDTVFKLTLGTDAVTKNDKGEEVPVEIEVSVIYNPSTKTLTFSNPGSQSLKYGVIIENGFEAIRMGNGTRYTLNGQALVVRNQDILVKGIDTSGYPSSVYSENDIEVIVTAPGYTTSDTLKNQVINLINGQGAAFDWTKSPAAKQAVNAALATVNEANVTSWRQAARTRAWNDNGIRGQSLTATTPTAYNNGAVCLVPYLEVNVTSYQASTTNASLTATLTFKWRVEVHPEASSNDPKVNDANNLAKNGVYIAKPGANLTLADDLGEGIKIVFKSGVNGAKFAHQAKTYDYEIGSTDKKITVTHAVSGNLGQFVFDSATPLIVLGDKPGTAGATTPTGDLSYFSTLQAAVDAAEDQKLIEISSAYTGATSINMTGKARTIYVQANGKNVVVANASGSLVEVNAAGTFYTIKLNRDNNAPATPAAVSVASATGGSGSVDKTSVVPGQSFVFTANPSTGYQAATPSASADKGTVTITASGTNKWTMTVPAGATKVTVTPRFVLNTGLPYTDVTDTSAWYFNAVKYCYDTTVKGYHLMEGDTNSIFGPNVVLNRAQTVQILYNMAGRPAVTGNCPFPDMAGYDWATPAVTWAAQKGYVIGFTDGKFHPEVKVSRQDLVTILYRYAGKPPVGNSSLAGYYDGDKVGDWAVDAVRWATSMGILSGTNSVALNGYINGPTKAKRCEVAVTVASFYSKGYAINN